MQESFNTLECSSQILCKSATWTWNIKDEKIFFSDGWKKMLGFSTNEITSNISEWTERLHPQDKFKTVKILASLTKDSNSYFDIYYRIKNKADSFCWMNCYGSATEFDDEGKALIISGIQQDVDELKTSEEYFKEINLRFSTLAENFGGAILLENEERKIFLSISNFVISLTSQFRLNNYLVVIAVTPQKTANIFLRIQKNL